MSFVLVVLVVVILLQRSRTLPEILSEQVFWDLIRTEADPFPVYCTPTFWHSSNWLMIRFPCVPLSSFRALQTGGHHAQAVAVWGAQHHHGLCVRGPRLALPAAGRCPEGGRVVRESRGCRGGQRGLREDGHHLPASGAELPRRPHASDCLQQSQCLP